MAAPKHSFVTDKMHAALAIAREQGAVYAGRNVLKSGVTRTVPASVLRALDRRGLLVLSVSPDGGMMGRPS